MSTALVPVEKHEEHIEDAETINAYGMLLPADRCDHCGAQAFVRAVHPSLTAWHGILNQDLLFCGHHFTRALATGKLDEWSVLDERAKIN